MAATSSRSTTAHTIFRIFYNTLYFFLCLLLVLLLLVSPGDAIRQALTYTYQIVNIPIIAATYVLAILIVLFVYFLRLYVTRTVLAQIPRNTIPIKKGDVKKQVRQMIAKDLGRSAAIAWEARPKVTGPDNKQHAAGAGGLGVVVEEHGHGDDGGAVETNNKKSKRKRSTSIESKLGIRLPPTKPVWGEIEHNGWGSPTSPDLPNLQYSTILSELPNLIEAKAVSQAPLADPTGALDMDAVDLLQRAPHMTMRDYVMHLTSLNVLPTTPAIADFLDAYERARFAPRPMSNADFRELMHLFAALLRNLGPLDPAVLYPGEDDANSIATSSGGGHIDDDAPRDTRPTTPARSVRSISSATTSSGSSLRFAPQRTRSAHHGRIRPTSGQHYGTAPTTPMSRAPTFRTRAGDMTRRSTSSSLTSSSTSPGGFAPSRRLYRVGTSSSSNSSSGGGAGSVRSLGATSSAGGSVIRLASRDEEPAGGLPYVLRIGDMF